MKDKINVIIKIYKEIPQSRTLNILIFLIQLLPLFIITHDFNLNFHYGISYFFRAFALCDLFANINKCILYFISLILFIFAIIIIISFSFVLNNISKYDKIITQHESLLKANTLIIFYVFYFLNQYIYSIFIEQLFCQGTPMSYPHGILIKSGNECQNLIYYIMLIIICFVSLFTFLSCVLVYCVHYDICFMSSSINMAKLNSIDFTYIIYPLFQAAIQLEYHMAFNITLIIKNCIRGLFVIGYCYNYYTLNLPFTSFKIHYFVTFVNSMCFISCIVEWCFFFDINNYMAILTKTNIIITLKMVFEVVISKLLVDYYLHREKIKIKQFITIGLKGGNYSLTSIQKFFYFIYYRYKHVNWFIVIAKLVLKGYKENIHSPLCSQNCFFCNDFSPQPYQLQLNETVNEIEKEIKIHFDLKYLIEKNALSLIETFPLLQNLMKYIITKCYDFNKEQNRSSHSVQKIEASLICAMYYYIFEGNHYKSLFFIEEITKTAVYNEKTILRLQINIFKYKITTHYKLQNCVNGKKNANLKLLVMSPDEQFEVLNDKNKSTIIKEMHMNYQCIVKIIKGEKMLIDSVIEYQKIMELMYSDMITYRQFAKSIQIFKKQTQYNMLNIPLIFNNKSSCSLPYSPEKFWIYFGYFGNKDAKEVEAIELYFSPSITINQKNEYSVLVLNSIVNKDKISFQIEYISDLLLNILGYSSTEFKILDFNQFLSTTFVKPYNYTLEQAIKTGRNKIHIKNFCLIDKERYAMMFHLTGITIYSQNTLKIFCKIEEAKEQITINQNKKNKMNIKSKTSSAMNSYCGTCFLFAKKNGKITSICRDFEQMFFLTSAIINKYNINMKELLKVEQLNSGGTIERDLITVFNNIIEINIMKVGSSGEDDFSKQVPLLKEALDIISALPQKLTMVVNYEEQQMPKSAKKNSKFYLFVLSISSLNEIQLKEINDTLIGETACNYQTSLMRSDNLGTWINNNSSSKSMRHKEEIFELIYLIKIISFKHLFKRYSLMTKNFCLNHHVIIFEGKKIENNNDRREKTNQNEMSDKSNNKKQRIDREIYQTKSNESTKEMNKIFLSDEYYPSMPLLFKIISYSIFCLVFVAIIFLSIERNDNFTIHRDYYQILSYIELSRSLVVNFQATIIYMLFQGNNLQNDMIDNGISISYKKLLSNLNTDLTDYEYVLSSINHFFCYFSEDIDPKYESILEGLYSVIVLNKNYKASIKGEKFTNLLSLGNMIRILNNSEPVKVYFNQTNKLYIKDKSINFYTEEVYVKVIENYNTLVRYVFIEIINAYPELVFRPIIKYRIIISVISMICASILIVFGIVIMIVILYYYKYVFAQHLITFVELRFFYFYLEKKTQLILEYLKNNGEKKDMRNLLSLDYQNEKKKLNQLLSLHKENKDLVIKIAPFNCIQPGLSKNLKKNEIQALENLTNDIEDFKANIKWENKLSPQSKKSTAGLLGVIKTKASSKGFVIPCRVSSQLTTSNRIRNPNIIKNAKSYNNNQSSKVNHSNPSFEQNGTNRLLNTSKTGSSILSNVNLLQTTSPSSHTKAQPNPHLGYHLSNINLNEQNGKPLIEKPKDNLIAFSFFALELLLLLICGIIDVIYTNLNVDNVMLLLSCQYTLLNQINSAQDFLLTYQLSILYNREIVYNYSSHGYLNICSDTEYVNNITIHNIFNELKECYSSLINDTNKIMNSPSYSLLKNTRNYLTAINTEDFCKTFSQYPSKYLNTVDHLRLFYDLFKNEDMLYTNCEKVGNGLNSKGISNTLNSMYISLVNLYYDFLSDLSRDGNSNKLRLNHPKVLTFQAEILKVFTSMPIQYLSALSMDYNQIDINYNLVILIITIIESVLILLIIFQLHLLIKKNNDENDNIKFLEKCLIRTILF